MPLGLPACGSELKTSPTRTGAGAAKAVPVKSIMVEIVATEMRREYLEKDMFICGMESCG
jgi:hypothetical protein